MRLFIQLRNALSALLVLLLVTAMASGECVACGVGASSSLQSSGCCNPDGQCKGEHHRTPPRCVQEQSTEFIVVAQLGQVPPVLPPADFWVLSSTESAPNAAILVAFRVDYSPPEHHILHSALLI